MNPPEYLHYFIYAFSEKFPCLKRQNAFLRKIQNCINRITRKKIVLLYGMYLNFEFGGSGFSFKFWILNLEVVGFSSNLKILNLEVVVFPSKFKMEVVVFSLNFWNTTIIWQNFLHKSTYQFWIFLRNVITSKIKWE